MEKIMKPKISVIVPVYNGEAFIHRCLDSLIYQTMEEIEIIVVDNKSTDRSWEILKEYQCHFPEKVRIFMLDKHSDGPGAGRNLGLKYAQADYIGFADIDDFFEYNAFELMYEKAISEECDLVYVASYDLKGKDLKITRTLPTGSREEILTIGSMVFWNKLIHKDLFEKAGKIPEGMVFEDLAYCSTLVSYAEKIGYISTPLYYYVIREDSGVNTLEPSRVLKSLEAEDIGLKNCNSEYLDYFADSVAMRICNDIRDRWQFTDSYIEQLRKIKPYLENNDYFLNDKRNFKRVEIFYKLADKPMPCQIYLNGFLDKPANDFIEYVKEKAFFSNTKIIVLDENTCDIEENTLEKNLLEKNKKELLGQYLALKKIYQDGGIYLDSCIEIDMPFNCLRYYEAFFGYSDKENFTDKIWGGIANSKVIYKIMKRIEQDQNEKKLDQIIKEICMFDLDIPINGKTNLTDYSAAVLAPCVLMYDDGSFFHMACHNFKKYSYLDEYITIKRSSIK